MDTPSWLDSLERKLGGWAIPHLIRGLVILNALTFLLETASPGFTNSLVLSGPALQSGEWWRVITFLMVPTVGQGALGVVFLFFFMWITWVIGEALEGEWGSFKVTLFLVIPVVCLTVLTWGLGIPIVPNEFIMRSLFLAFATLFPNFELMLFPLPIPIKVKWLGMVYGGWLVLACILSPLSAPVILSSMAGYLLFFVPGLVSMARQRAATRERRRRFEEDSRDE